MVDTEMFVKENLREVIDILAYEGYIIAHTPYVVERDKIVKLLEELKIEFYEH